MKSDTFIRAFFEENIINYKKIKNDMLFGEYFNARFSLDTLMANRYIANSYIMEYECDWNKAKDIYIQALNWKNNTVYNISEDVISDESDSIIFWDKFTNKDIIKILNTLKSKYNIEEYLFSNDILLLYKKSIYYIKFNKKIFIKFFTNEEFTNEKIELLILSVPWRLMAIFGEIGLQKSYLEAGRIAYFIECAIKEQNIEYYDNDMIYQEDEMKYGYSNIEKKIIKKYEVKINE